MTTTTAPHTTALTTELRYLALTPPVYAALGASMFLLTLQLQQTVGYSALAAGAATVPMTIIMLLLFIIPFSLAIVAIIENADQTSSPFALGFEIQGDQKGSRIWLYNCSCTRPNQETSTKEKGTTPVTDKLSITVAPRLSDKQIKVSMTLSESNSTAYNGFFSTVYEEDEA